MDDHARGGNDIVTCSLRGTAYGDAETMSGHAVGGNDTVRGAGATFEVLVGDARSADGHVRCGNDRIVSGSGWESLWGDAQTKGPCVITGADTFVFDLNNGRDGIGDFEHHKDVIDLTAWAAVGIDGFDDLHIAVDGSDSVIDLDGVNQIRVAGVTDLDGRDFLFH
jgi:hypothetical protein